MYGLIDKIEMQSRNVDNKERWIIRSIHTGRGGGRDGRE